MQFIFRLSDLHTCTHSGRQDSSTVATPTSPGPNQLKPADIKGLRQGLILLARGVKTGHPQRLTQNIKSINPVVTRLLSQC